MELDKLFFYNFALDKPPGQKVLKDLEQNLKIKTLLKKTIIHAEVDKNNKVNFKCETLNFTTFYYIINKNGIFIFII